MKNRPLRKDNADMKLTPVLQELGDRVCEDGNRLMRVPHLMNGVACRKQSSVALKIRNLNMTTINLAPVPVKRIFHFLPCNYSAYPTGSTGCSQLIQGRPTGECSRVISPASERGEDPVPVAGPRDFLCPFLSRSLSPAPNREALAGAGNPPPAGSGCRTEWKRPSARCSCKYL